MIKQKPKIKNITGGLSGPAIKPVALAKVLEISRNVDIPIIGIGGISTIDDVMEFLVAGASAVQIGTANYYNPTVSMTILDQLPTALGQLGANCIEDIVRSLQVPQPTAAPSVAPIV